MRIGEFRMARMALIIAISLSMLAVACFGGSPEPTPTPEPTPEPPTVTPVPPTATSIPTQTPLPPVLPPMPSGSQQSGAAPVQPVPTIAVRLIVAETPTPEPTSVAEVEDTPTVTPAPTETPVPTTEPSPTPEPTATVLPPIESSPTPTHVPVAEPEPTVEPSATPIPEPTTRPTPNPAPGLLANAFRKLSDAPGYHQEMTLTYHFASANHDEPPRREFITLFNHVKPDLMEGSLMVPGLMNGWNFTSVGEEIYALDEDGYHVPASMPMRLKPTDALLCNLVLCDSPENLQEARLVQTSADSSGALVHEIEAVHAAIGHPHALNDPETRISVMYRLDVAEGSLREVQFEGVDLDRSHFWEGRLDPTAGLGIHSIARVTLDMKAKVAGLTPDTHIHQPQLRPEPPPAIARVEFYAGSFTSRPNDLSDCTPRTCGAVEITFTRPVLALGEVHVWVDGKDFLQCARGCSNTEPSDTMFFYGSIWEGEEDMSVWVAPGDRTGTGIFQNKGAVITDEYLVELSDYAFEARIIAQPSEHPPLAPPSGSGG